jgi:hypothetical protein
MSGKSKSNQSTYSSNSFEPWVTSFGQDLVGQAGSQVDSNPWQAYQGPTQGEFGQGFDAANQYLMQQLGSVTPETQMAGSSLAQLLTSMDPTRSVASYMNPYVEQTLQPTLRNINEAAATKGGDLARQATMAGAYGDSSHGVQRSLVERDRQRNIGDATAAAYDKAYTQATAARSDELSKYLQTAGALGNTGQQIYQQGTGLAQMLAGLGAQEQQANQSGIQTNIALNQQNQDKPLQQFTTLAQLLAMIPKNTTGYSNTQNSAPDNSGLAFLSSLI